MRIKKIHIILMTVTMFSMFLKSGYAQKIGGSWTPLLNSVHQYRIQMGNVNYTPNWGLYPAGTTAGQIEDGTADALALTPDVDYTLVALLPAEQIVGVYAYWKIQFNKNIVANTTYVLGYKETTSGDDAKCYTAVVRDVNVQPPLDIDMIINDGESLTDCSDNDNDFLSKNELDNGFQTETIFKVYFEHPLDDVGDDTDGYIDGGGTWTFRLNVVVTGQGGTDGSINTITATDRDPTDVAAVNLGTYTPGAGTSEYTTPTITVSPSGTPVSTVTPVFVSVVYNEVLGIDQLVTLEIESIYGQFNERDIDEVNNTQLVGKNIVQHTIYGMPNVGTIEAMN